MRAGFHIGASPSLIKENTVDNETLAERLEEIADSLMVLSQLHLTAPAEAAYDGICGLGWFVEFDNDSFRRGNELLQTGETATYSDVVDDLNYLYGVTARAKVPPYESYHRGLTHVLFDEETLQVRAEYRAAGLEAPRLNREPDDHLGLELNFLELCLRNGEYRRARTFMDEHVMQWAPAMLADGEEAADTDFYAGIMAITLGVLEELNSVLDEAIERFPAGGTAGVEGLPTTPPTATTFSLTDVNATGKKGDGNCGCGGCGCGGK